MPENENPPEKRNKEKIKDVQLFSVFSVRKKELQMVVNFEIKRTGGTGRGREWHLLVS